jgi:Na+-transporting NADH:ubiquinone oxidoreductase subunit NqrB
MKEKFKLISKTRIIISAAVSALLVFYFFNFIPRDINILASRSLERQILDYALNFVVFFVSLYFLLSVATFLYRKIT